MTTKKEPKRIFICATCNGEFETKDALEQHWYDIGILHKKGEN